MSPFRTLTGLRGRPALLLVLVIVPALASCRGPAPTTLPPPAPGHGVASSSSAPTPGAPAPTAPSGVGLNLAAAGSPGEPNPRPYAAVVTPAATSRRGLVTTHQVRSRLLFEITSNELGTDLLLVRTLRGSPNPLPLFGTLSGSRVVRFERREHRVLLRAVSYQSISSDTVTAFNRALDLVRYAPILATFNVEAYGQDSAVVIDVTRLFVGGVSDLIAGFPPAAPRTADQSRSFIERVATFDRNVEIDASQTFGATPGPSMPGVTLVGPGTSSELYRFSLVRLPERPMMPRLADARVGYFGSTQYDWGSPEQRVASRTLIHRWRLECASGHDGTPSAADPCIPTRPITFYVDPATPGWLVPWIKRGIEEWQPAFVEAGFARAIVAREIPTDSLDVISGEDATVSMVRWVPSTVPNAIGPSIVDPRTGEILDADVQMLHNILSLQRDWYVTQVGHLDPRVHQLPMPDSLMGRLVQFVVAHEVGHSLGLPHNMKASSMYPLDSIRSPTWVARMGHSPSIMDYSRFNYVAQPEDQIPLEHLVPTIGPYDRYAVRWGYAPIPGARTPEDERATLDQWARLQDSVPWYRFAGSADPANPDPGEANEAVGDADAVRATALGIRNLERVAKLITPAATARTGQPLDALEELYGALIDQWATELSHVARIPGGFSKQEKATGQTGVVYAPLSRTRQRDAVAFLNTHAFRTPRFLIDPMLLRRLEAAGSIERIGAAQRRVLDVLLNTRRLQRMVDAEAVSGTTGAYALADLLADVRRGVWREIETGAPIDPYRRRLQRGYLDVLASKINPSAPVLPPGIPAALAAALMPPSAADARAQLRGELLDLERALIVAAARTSDRASRQHIVAARAQIDAILNPRR